MKRLTAVKGKLLEGCVWDEKLQKLYFVDIEKKILYCYCPEDQILQSMQLPQPVSCIVPEKADTVVAALKDGLYRVDFAQCRYKKIMDNILENDVRFNDGKCDQYGNLWVGSMSFGAETNRGSLFCIRQEKVIRFYQNYTIPNGLVFNDQQNIFYHVDTPRKAVDRYTVVNQCDLKDRSICLDLSGEDGIPDGMCADAQGNLWIAIWGGGKIVCYDPVSGSKRSELSVPGKNVTCCTFGGSNLDQLFVTTAEDENTAGELYVFSMDVKGEIVNRYGN